MNCTQSMLVLISFYETKHYCELAGHSNYSVYILLTLLQNNIQQRQNTIQNVRRMVKQDLTKRSARMLDALGLVVQGLL